MERTDMHLVVWVREVPDTRDLVGDVLDASGTPRWGDWDSRVDAEDLNALEMALQVRDAGGACRVTAVSVGAPRRLDVLRECLYRGVDDVTRIRWGGGVPGILGEARLVAGALRRMGAVDALFTGVQMNEGEAAHKGTLAARILSWPAVSYVEAWEGWDASGMRLRRAIEGGIQVVLAPFPAVVSVGVALLKDDPRAPRSAKAKLKLQHKKTPIAEWDPEVGEGEAAGQGPWVRASGYRALPQRAFPSQRVDGNDATQLLRMIEALRAQGLVR